MKRAMARGEGARQPALEPIRCSRCASPGRRSRSRPGSSLRLAMDIGGERIARPFSFVNPPADPVHEFYGIVCPRGRSPRLSRACSRAIRSTGAQPRRLSRAVRGAGRRDAVARLHRTGIAPFLSILRTEAPWRRFSGTSSWSMRCGTRRKLVYRDLILEISRKQSFVYVTFVSRSPIRDRCPDASRRRCGTDGWSRRRASRLLPNRPRYCYAEIPTC